MTTVNRSRLSSVSECQLHLAVLDGSCRDKARNARQAMLLSWEDVSAVACLIDADLSFLLIKMAVSRLGLKKC